MSKARFHRNWRWPSTERKTARFHPRQSELCRCSCSPAETGETGVWAAHDQQNQPPSASADGQTTSRGVHSPAVRVPLQGALPLPAVYLPCRHSLRALAGDVEIGGDEGDGEGGTNRIVRKSYRFSAPRSRPSEQGNTRDPIPLIPSRSPYLLCCT